MDWVGREWCESLRFEPLGIKTVAKREHVLVVIHGGAAADGESALHEVVHAEIEIEIGGEELGLRVARVLRGEGLVAGQNLQKHGIVETAADRNGFVMAAAEGAVEFRVVGVGAQLGPRNAIEGNAVQLVQRACRIAGAIALANVGVEPDFGENCDAHAAAQALKQEFVEQAGADQGRIEGLADRGSSCSWR